VARHLGHIVRRGIGVLRLDGVEDVENGSEADVVRNAAHRRCRCSGNLLTPLTIHEIVARTMRAGSVFVFEQRTWQCSQFQMGDVTYQ